LRCRKACALSSEEGLDVTGIDTSPLAIKICRLRGLGKAKILPFDQIDKFPEDSFDTIVLMGNNFGLFGGFQKTKKLLHKLHRITSANATIIATTTDPYKTDNPIHLRYHKLNPEEVGCPVN
jgi:hypothetical protein